MPGQVTVVPYRPEWPELFEAERERLRGALCGLDATIEHGGSTSVPGLAAKPTIDVLVGVTGLEQMNERIDDMVAVGYHYVPKYEVRMPDRRYFRRPDARPRLAHVHVLEVDGVRWLRHLAFRDWLREHPDDAHAYAALKFALAHQYRHDRPGYTDAKNSFITMILKRALS